MLIRIKKLAFLLGFLVLLAPLAMASGGTTGTITKPPEIVTYAMVSDSVGKDFENEPMFKETEAARNAADCWSPESTQPCQHSAAAVPASSDFHWDSP